MAGKTDLLKVFEREPNKTFSTTMLVEAVYPEHMRSIREHMQFGSTQQKRTSQLLKSKLHRKLLYYVGKLVEEGALSIDRIDAHGEKIYRIAKASVTVQSKEGIIHITQQAPKTHHIAEELAAKQAFIYEEQSILSRIDSFYIDCARVEGLGQLTKLVDTTLGIVNDVVCIGDFQTMLQKYHAEDLQEFINTLMLQTLDEARSVCILLDTRNTDVSAFTKLIAATLPKRVYLVFICNHKSILTPEFAQCIASLQERHEKINIHFAPLHPHPLFVGQAGMYGIQEPDWTAYHATPEIPGFIVSQASIALDMSKLDKLPPHIVRQSILNAAKALYSIASQQRLMHTGVDALQTIHKDTHKFFLATSTYLRFWNYDWEANSLLIQSTVDTLQTFNHTQRTIYRACGLPFHFNLQLSSTFTKFHKQLSTRTYRKQTIMSSRDFETPAFQRYVHQRLHYLQQFNNIDRFRIFRGGTPAPEQVAQEALRLAIMGFPFITVDFQKLQGVKRLTEYFA